MEPVASRFSTIVKVHTWPRLSFLSATVAVLTGLAVGDSVLNPERRAGSVLDFATSSSGVGVIGLFVASLALWFVLRSQIRRLQLARFPNQIAYSQGFQSKAGIDISVPKAFGIFRNGRRLDFIAKLENFTDAEKSAPKRPAPFLQLYFVTARAAILQEQKFIYFFGPQSEEEFIAVNSAGRNIRKGSFVSRARQSPATSALILMNVIASVAAWSFGENTFMQGALRAYEVKHGEYYRIVTSMFLHASLLHLLMNMFALYSLGGQVERIVGSRKLILIYFFCGFSAAIYSLFWIDQRPLVGASGAIFGLFGSIGSYIYWGRNRLPEGVYLPTARQLSTDLLINGALSMLPFISFSAHFGGFVAGLFITTLLHKEPKTRIPHHAEQ